MAVESCYYVGIVRQCQWCLLTGACEREIALLELQYLPWQFFSDGFRRYLIQNLDWLEEQLDEVEDDYILFDLPGLIF